MAAKWSAQLDTLAQYVTDIYVFPEVGTEIARVLLARLADGAYEQVADQQALAAAVTEDLQSVNGDKHLRLQYRVEEIPEGAEPFDEQTYLREAELEGYGFARVQRLAGNVGLLEITKLHDAPVGGQAAIAAMTLLAGTDVLLIDLRRNLGGDPAMVALLCSYLFDEPTHLNDLYYRQGEVTHQFWTLPYVPGPRFGADKPVFVLTSTKTFSGGEELANNLRELGRATLVGEPTRGGAHPGGRYRVDTHLQAAVPSGRAINPVSGTNWEGVGVQPHVAVPAQEALEVAYRRALAHVLQLDPGGARRAVSEEARTALAELS